RPTITRQDTDLIRRRSPPITTISPYPHLDEVWSLSSCDNCKQLDRHFLESQLFNSRRFSPLNSASASLTHQCLCFEQNNQYSRTFSTPRNETSPSDNTNQLDRQQRATIALHSSLINKAPK
ncbi:Hypothetical protein, putative, partial [Bodo saltans]